MESLFHRSDDLVGVINRSEWPWIIADIIADTRFGGGRIPVGVGDILVVSTGRRPKEVSKETAEDD